MRNSRRWLRSPGAMLPLVLVGLVLPADDTRSVPAPGPAHGSLEVPLSRAYRCYREGPERPPSAACLEAALVAGTQQFYDWNEVNLPNADGRHRELIPDGSLCSAGRDKYRGLDLARDDWPVQTMAPDARGGIDLVYRATAPHSTLHFTFHVTKDGFDPTRPLAWSDLEDEPFCTVADPFLRDERYHLRCLLPPGKVGRHLIYGIWERDDSPEAFYACSDVVILPSDGEPSPEPEPSFPGEPSPQPEPSSPGEPSPQPEPSVPAERPAEACGTGPWNPRSVYLNGDRVMYGGRHWRARWWSQGEPPNSTSEWGVWEEVAAC